MFRRSVMRGYVLVTRETAGRVTLFEQLNATEKLAFLNDQLFQQCFGSKMPFAFSNIEI